MALFKKSVTAKTTFCLKRNHITYAYSNRQYRVIITHDQTSSSILSGMRYYSDVMLNISTGAAAEFTL